MPRLLLRVKLAVGLQGAAVDDQGGGVALAGAAPRLASLLILSVPALTVVPPV